MRLEDKSCSELNLARTADGTEHTPRIIGKVASRILKYGIPISSLRERILRIAWDNEVRMIQKVSIGPVSIMSRRGVLYREAVEQFKKRFLTLVPRGKGQ